MRRALAACRRELRRFVLGRAPPDGNGLDLLEEIRRTAPDLPVIAMSGEDSHYRKARAAALGAAVFMHKSLSTRHLGQVLQSMTGIRSAAARARLRYESGETATVMMYSHDGFGLGHFRRNANIASRFAAEVPDGNVLMLVGTAHGGMFDLPSGVDYVKLPSILKEATNGWKSRSLRIPFSATIELRSQIIGRTVELFPPDLFLVDHLPIGVAGELLPTLRMLRQMRNPPKVVLGLRDILDTPELVRTTWRHDGVYDVIREFYDAVLVYGRESIYDTVAHYGLRSVASTKVHYCGYLCTESQHRSREHMRRSLAVSCDKLIVIMAGGGHDAYPMTAACLEAIAKLELAYDAEAILITGPLMDTQLRVDLEQRAAKLPVRVIGSVTDSLSYLNAADLVITMGGYNTLMESVTLGKKTLVIPRCGPSAEQRIRAEMLDERGLARTMELGEASPSALARLIERMLDEDAPTNQAIGPNGLSEVVRRMKQMVDARYESNAASPAPAASDEETATCTP